MKKKSTTNISNRDLITSLFNQITEATNFHIINIDWGNSYYLFEGEEDSVCHFYIKEIPGFKFGIWTINRYDTIQYQLEHNIPLWSDTLDINSKSELIFFTQYEQDLDKFKPSRSGFVTGLWRETWQEENDKGEIVTTTQWITYNLVDILNYMHKHKIRAAIHAGHQSRYIWDDDRSGFKIFKEFMHDKLYHIHYIRKEAKQLKHAIRAVKKTMNKIKTFDYIVRDEGECVYPRIDIQVRHKEQINIADYDKDCILLDKLQDKHFHNLNIQYNQYFDPDDLNNRTYIRKDKRTRAWFYWFCNKWINGPTTEYVDKSEIICYNVDFPEDMDKIQRYVKRYIIKDEH